MRKDLPEQNTMLQETERKRNREREENRMIFYPKLFEKKQRKIEQVWQINSTL